MDFVMVLLYWFGIVYVVILILVFDVYCSFMGELLCIELKVEGMLLYLGEVWMYVVFLFVVDYKGFVEVEWLLFKVLVDV